MNVYLAGICGTFMAGLARLAHEAGFKVGGCDGDVWPPMSTQLELLGVEADKGWKPDYLDRGWEQVVFGNVLSRGNPVVEAVLKRRIPFSSGPQWLSENLLGSRDVVAVAGTHGKTTTTAMLAWILECASIAGGFLIGGLPANFPSSARTGRPSAPFVIEADEYDTAFFDKRPKFMHYHPRLLVMNNLEFDHADVYENIEAIQRQFHYLVRTVPGDGRILYRASDQALHEVLQMGVWTPCETFGVGTETADWTAVPEEEGFGLSYRGKRQGSCRWHLIGRHNVANAAAAVAAAACLGVSVSQALHALETFEGVGRRLEIVGNTAGVVVYDDFAHHPTAIAATLQAVREQIARNDSGGRLLAVFEPRSNSMKMGVHRAALGAAFDSADRVFLYQPPTCGWSPADVLPERLSALSFTDTTRLLESVCREARPHDRIVVMSNGAFDGLPLRISRNLADESRRPRPASPQKMKSEMP